MTAKRASSEVVRGAAQQGLHLVSLAVGQAQGPVERSVLGLRAYLPHPPPVPGAGGRTGPDRRPPAAQGTEPRRVPHPHIG